MRYKIVLHESEKGSVFPAPAFRVAGHRGLPNRKHWKTSGPPFRRMSPLV